MFSSPWMDSSLSWLKMVDYCLFLKILTSLLGILRLSLNSSIYSWSSLHLQIEMMGFPILNFTHPADQSKIRRSLQKKEDESSCRLHTFMKTAEDISEVSASSRSSTPHPLVPYQPTTPERGPRQSFYIRLREKPLAKQDMPQYEHMHVVGHLRRQEDTKDDKARTGGHHTFIGVMRPVRDR